MAEELDARGGGILGGSNADEGDVDAVGGGAGHDACDGEGFDLYLRAVH